MSSYYQQIGQLEFDFGFNPQCDKYVEAYNTGLTWDANWMPGGPDVYRPRSKYLSGELTPEQKIKGERSQFEADQWLAGFKEGLKMRLANNPHFAAWWDQNYPPRKPGYAGYARYQEPSVDTDS